MFLEVLLPGSAMSMKRSTEPLNELTQRVTCGEKIMKYRLFISFIAITGLLAGCSNYGRRDMGNVLSQSGGMSSNPGGRIAAALMVPGVQGGFGNSSYLKPGMDSTQNQRVQGTRSGWSSDRQMGQVTTPPNGESGFVETLSFNTSQMDFVGDRGSYGARYQGVSNGILGRPTGFSVAVSGINAKESQIAYSTDRSLLYVTAPEINSVWAIPMSDNGSFWGSARKLELQGHPTEIATGRSEYGDHAAVVTKNGIALLTANRINLGTGGSEAEVTNTMIQFGNDRPTAVAFSPSGQYLFVGVEPITGIRSRVGGSVKVCDLGKTAGYEPRRATESYFTNNTAMGCVDGNPGLARGYSSGRLGIGSQMIDGLPLKLAVTQEMAVSLNDMFGPYILETPDIPDMDPLFVDRIVRAGQVQNSNYNRKSFGFAEGQAVDMAIDPRTNAIYIAKKKSVLHYSMDNVNEVGRVPHVIPLDDANISSIAMDPGSVDDPSTAEIVAFGDLSGGVWISKLGAGGINRPYKVHMSNAVIDVAIGTRTNFLQGRSSKAADSKPVATTKEQPAS